MENTQANLDDYIGENESLKEDVWKLEGQSETDRRDLNTIKERLAQVEEENRRLTVMKVELEVEKRS